MHTCMHIHTHTYEVHSLRYGNYFLVGQKCSKIENGVEMLQSTWHALVNVTIQWDYMFSSQKLEASEQKVF